VRVRDPARVREPWRPAGRRRLRGRFRVQGNVKLNIHQPVAPPDGAGRSHQSHQPVASPDGSAPEPLDGFDAAPSSPADKPALKIAGVCRFQG
jgi:hypothetical protein